MNKHAHLDNVVKNFLENLVLSKPIYEMSADDTREFLAEIQQRDYEDLTANVEDISIFIS